MLHDLMNIIGNYITGTNMSRNSVSPPCYLILGHTILLSTIYLKSLLYLTLRKIYQIMYKHQQGIFFLLQAKIQSTLKIKKHIMYCKNSSQNLTSRPSINFSYNIFYYNFCSFVLLLRNRQIDFL